MKPNVKIVKIGGNIINDKVLLNDVLNDFAYLEGPKILIHGGGKKATEVANLMGLEPKMINGRRVTDAKTLETVTMVYAGLLNKNIVAQLQSKQCNAIGLTGADANLIKAHQRIVNDIDYGFAGDIDQIESVVLGQFIQLNLVPVFCAITHNQQGQLLNTNADTIAAEIAAALAIQFQVELIYCFEKNGVLHSVLEDDSVIETIDGTKYLQLKKDKIIADGMLPKLENCFAALNKGVAKVLIGNPTIIKNRNQKYTTLTL